jgi:hypothetical protein
MSEVTDLKQRLNEEGSFKATFTIKGLPEPAGKGKVGRATVEETNVPLRYWVSDKPKFAKPLEVGASAEVEVAVKPGQQGLEAWIVSFGGANAQKGGGNQGGGGGQRGYTPKTDAEIHCASVAGIVKSCLDFTKDIGQFDPVFDKAMAAYKRGIDLMSSGKASAVSASPQQAKAPAVADSAPFKVVEGDQKEDPNRQAKADADEYWRSINGSKEEHTQLREICKDRGLKFYEVILKGKQSNASPAAIIRIATGPPAVGIAEPGDHRNPACVPEAASAAVVPEDEPGKDWYVEYCDVAARLGWPAGYAEAPTAYQALYKRALGRDIKSQALVNRLTPHDFYTLTQFALRVEAGTEDAPFGFKTHTKEAKGA